jgi:hypothetical protein
MKYRVQYARTVVVYFEVEAESLAEAENLAQDLEDNGSLDFWINNGDERMVWLPDRISAESGENKYCEFHINTIENDNGYWNVMEVEDADYTLDGGN